MKKLWFKAKRYGYGWTPSSWEGWLVLLVYLIFMLWLAFRFDNPSYSKNETIWPFILISVPVTALLIWICYKTGEKPRWRWGKDDTDKSEPKR